MMDTRKITKNAVVKYVILKLV